VSDDDLVRAVFVSAKAKVAEAAGCAMAAVLLGKTPGAVTPEEAARALADYVREGDADLTARAVRAGVKAVVMALEGDPFPTGLAGEVVGGLNSLDAGEGRGWAIPANVGAWRKPPGRRREIASWIAVETAFQEGRYGCSRDRGLTRATGARRPGSQTAVAAPQLLPLASWDLALQLEKEGRAFIGEGIDSARREGAALAAGGVLTPDFNVFRRGYLALAADPTAWRRVLRNAKIA
jgi:hypothetical protein